MKIEVNEKTYNKLTSLMNTNNFKNVDEAIDYLIESYTQLDETTEDIEISKILEALDHLTKKYQLDDLYSANFLFKYRNEKIVLIAENDLGEIPLSEVLCYDTEETIDNILNNMTLINNQANKLIKEGITTPETLKESIEF
jgi:hypothetical protein